MLYEISETCRTRMWALFICLIWLRTISSFNNKRDDQSATASWQQNESLDINYRPNRARDTFMYVHIKLNSRVCECICADYVSFYTWTTPHQHFQYISNLRNDLIGSFSIGRDFVPAFCLVLIRNGVFNLSKYFWNCMFIMWFKTFQNCTSYFMINIQCQYYLIKILKLFIFYWQWQFFAVAWMSIFSGAK